MDRRRRPVVVWLIPVMAAMIGLSRVMSSAAFQTYRTVDVVQLIGSGFCFGAAFTGVILMLRGGSSR